jgi:peptidoglycan/xylan/chitin deacetylase (PgdA/CDA1 family)
MSAILTALFIAVAAAVFAVVAWNMVMPISGDKSASLMYGAKDAVVDSLPLQLLPDSVKETVDPLLQIKQAKQQLAVAYDGGASGRPCNCVVFRLDDVQDSFARDAQLQIMDLFIKKNQPVSLGVIAGHYGDDPHVTHKVMEGVRAGLFEVAIHGWDHVDYSTLGEKEQADTLQRSNEKFAKIFGSPSSVFIAPYNRFNNDTIAAINGLGGSIKVISASTTDDRDASMYLLANGTRQQQQQQDAKKVPMPYHIPATAAFRDKEDPGGAYTVIPVEKILADVDASVAKYGYAVVMMHPQDFLVVENGKYTKKVNAAELADLERLVDSVEAKGLQTTTFYGIYGKIQ